MGAYLGLMSLNFWLSKKTYTDWNAQAAMQNFLYKLAV